jgi:hypothetical protein
MIVHRVELRDIQGMRDMYRHEMNCQIIHDSIHVRPGWSHEYLITEGGGKVGYGSVAVAGPWQASPTVYEYFVLPQFRGRIFALFSAFLTSSGATMIETQSNAPLLTVMLHAFATTVASESILFHDRLTTAHAPPGALVRRVTPEDAAQIAQQQLDSGATWLVEVEGSCGLTRRASAGKPSPTRPMNWCLCWRACWEKVYDVLVKDHQFHPRPGLIGLSRAVPCFSYLGKKPPTLRQESDANQEHPSQGRRYGGKSAWGWMACRSRKMCIKCPSCG